MTKTQKKIAKRNARAFTTTYPDWNVTVHFSKVKKNGKRTITTIMHDLGGLV